MTLLVAVVAGALIGLSLGALGGGGSILAVPVLVYALGQSPAQATTGSLVVVGVTSLVGAITAYAAGNVMLARGVAFGVVALGGAVAGARASASVPEPVLLASFAVLMLAVGVLLAVRQWRGRRAAPDGAHARRPALDDPIITFSPTFACQCPRALKVLVTATLVGLLTGFLGVGGGFLVVPALLVALSLPMAYAAGTSLVVITLTSAVALLVRAGSGITPDWGPVIALTVAASVAAVVGTRIAVHADTRRLSAAFTGLVLARRGLHRRAGPARPRLRPSTHPRPPGTRTEHHHVSSSPMQDLRQDHLERLRPARRPGDGRRTQRGPVPRAPEGRNASRGASSTGSSAGADAVVGPATRRRAGRSPRVCGVRTTTSECGSSGRGRSGPGCRCC